MNIMQCLVCILAVSRRKVRKCIERFRKPLAYQDIYGIMHKISIFLKYINDGICITIKYIVI